MADTFIRRVQLDLTQDVIPQLMELSDDPDPEIAHWAQENLRSEIELAKFTAWLANRGVQASRLALEEPSLFEQFRAERRPKLAVVSSSGRERRDVSR